MEPTSLIDTWIYLDWTNELGEWCAAKVLSFRPPTQENEVQYDDGEREWVNLLTPSRRWQKVRPKKVRNAMSKRARRLAREYNIKIGMSEALVKVADELLDMEDRLPNAGVRSQLPQFWKNLRVQILKCKAPKDMAAAAFKFAGQIKDNVLLEDWESKVAEWRVDAKRAATETEVATVVHQIKFEMVDWAQCRALFPSLAVEEPPNRKKVVKAPEQPKKKKKALKALPAKKVAGGTAAAVSSPTKSVAVECNGQNGAYQPQTHLILCLCSACKGQQEAMTLSSWERHVGSRAHNWSKSIHLRDMVGKLSTWLKARRESDPSFAFHQMSPAEKAAEGGPPAAPQVIPKAKVSQIPPQSVARFRQQSHPEMGQLSPEKKRKAKEKGGKGKRAREEDAAEHTNSDEDSSEAQPAKRLTRSIPVKQPGPEAEEAPRVASQAREQRQREATPVQQNEEEEQLTCVICNESDNSHEVLQCDGTGCGRAYHTYCLTPQLIQIPEGDWLCPSCVDHARKASGPSRAPTMSKHGDRSTAGNGLSFFQTMFNEGPSHHPLFCDSQAQGEDVRPDIPERLEEVMASQPPKSTFVLPTDIDDDALLAFTVPGSAYAAKLGC